MKLTARRLLIFFMIAVLSVGFGFAYDGIAHRVDLSGHPRPPEYVQLVAQQSQAFGVPEPIIWAMVQEKSDFSSNLQSENGAIGLLQITPDLMKTVCREVLHEEEPVEGLLFHPETNLRIGVAWLSALYQKYGVWESVFAAWEAGTDQTDVWLADPDCLDPQGQLVKIPDPAVSKFVSALSESADMYAELYYES